MSTSTGIPEIDRLLQSYRPPAAPDAIEREMQDALDDMSPNQIRAACAAPLSLDVFVREMLPVLKEWAASSMEHLVAALGEAQAEMAELPREILALKAVPQMRYAGVWTMRSYAPGETVTSHGSLFLAMRDVTGDEAPGTTDGWKLCCKRGKDGRDARAAEPRAESGTAVER
jgi:hypothetical protein